MYNWLVEKRDEVNSLVSPGRSISYWLDIIRVEVYWFSQLGVLIQDVLPEVFRQQISTFLGEDAQKLLERLERGPKLEIHQILAIGGDESEVVLNVREKRGKIVGIVPTPAGQILEIVLIDEFQTIHIVGQDIPKLFCLSHRVDPEIVQIKVLLAWVVSIQLHLSQTQESFLFLLDLHQKLFLQLILKILLLLSFIFLELGLLVRKELWFILAYFAK